MTDPQQNNDPAPVLPDLTSTTLTELAAKDYDTYAQDLTQRTQQPKEN